MKLLKIIILILPIISVSCKKNLVGPTSNNEFYPLKVGNTWEYVFKEYDSLGVLTLEGTFKDMIIADTSLNGLFMYEIKSPYYRSPDCCIYKYYFINEYDGIYIYVDKRFSSVTYQIYKYPCKLNDFFISSTTGDSSFVISLQDTVICEAGTFSCIVYEEKLKDSYPTGNVIGYAYIYVAIGVGKVKQEIFMLNGNKSLIKTSEYALKSYQLIN